LNERSIVEYIFRLSFGILDHIVPEDWSAFWTPLKVHIQQL
jgi:hypothetical protein